MNPKTFSITKVVSKNFIEDVVANFQNLAGRNLSSYEKMIDKGTKQCWEEFKKKRKKVAWYRFEITQLTNGAVAIILYGEYE